MASKELGTMILTASAIKGPNYTLYADEVSFAGGSDYAGDGLSGVQSALRALVGDQREVVAVIPIGPNGGYSVSYDQADSVLRVYQTATVASGGSAAAAQTEVPTTSLAGVTFKLLVLSI